MCSLFSGRGAFIHFGAMLGTIMVANVAMVIIPGQRALVAAKERGEAPDPIHGIRGKQRSVHNTYFTLPVLFTMISNHYGGLTQHRYNWVILVLVSVSGALVRLYFVARHRGAGNPVLAVASLAALAGAFALAWPAARPGPGGGSADGGAAVAPPFAEVQRIVAERCTGCHARSPTFQGFASAPANVAFDTPDSILRQAAAIHQQTVVTRAMPIGNVTAITDAERAALDAWFRAGAPPGP
jgi:uncharacterized membrane protein